MTVCQESDQGFVCVDGGLRHGNPDIDAQHRSLVYLLNHVTGADRDYVACLTKAGRA